MSSTPKTARAVLSGGSRVALAMVTMNAALYVFNIVAARTLEPRQFGAVTALLGVILVGNVAALGLQATTARRIAVAPENGPAIVATTTRVTLMVALGVGLVVALASPITRELLRLEDIWPALLCGASLVPLTIMGAQSGVAQGTERWNVLSAIYVANGVGRLIGGTAALAIDASTTSVMIGLAIGGWLPVLVGSRQLSSLHMGDDSPSRRTLLRETALGSHALLAYFVLSNLDALIARNLLSAHDSGLYASGLILSKAALFFPQFVSVVLFPDLARSSGSRARSRAALIVGGFGLCAVLGTALLPQLALILVGGDQYAEVSSRLWMFALAGSTLAVVHLLVFDALARQAHGVVVMLWGASVAVLAIAYGSGVDLAGLVTTVTGVALVLAGAAWLAPRWSKPDARGA